jgi:hypothetical protein
LGEEFERQINIQHTLSCAEIAGRLLWVLMVSGQITVCKVDGWQSLAQPPAELDLAA